MLSNDSGIKLEINRKGKYRYMEIENTSWMMNGGHCRSQGIH